MAQKTLTASKYAIVAEPKPAVVSPAKWILIGVAALLVLGAFIWQGLVAHGNPDPTARNLSASAVAFSAGILVFREGLEAVLVLAAITAGLSRYRKSYRPAMASGISVALAATVATWFIVVAIISQVNAPELAIQAATGLLAIVVLLVVMNWFFHRLYWTGWICQHCKRRNRIFEAAESAPSRVFFGLALLGFTAIYREGFEVVLFLQDLRLKAGSTIVLSGAAIGLALSVVVAILTFAAHRRLPYKKMLVYTGLLLALVLVVMVGESVQEMQQAGWLATHQVNLPLPDWTGVWFATFPNWEGLGAQLLAALVVGGSYLWVRSRVPKVDGKAVTAQCDA